MPHFPKAKKIISRLFAGALLLLSFESYSQDYKFSHLTEQDGLSQAVVNCIFQDKQGFMWFGTQEGLNRYDGYSFEIFKRNPSDSNSLSNNFIYALIQDKNGIIWIGTNGGGLNAFDPVTRKFLHYTNDPADPSSISNDVVRAIYEDHSGNIWIGTDKGLNRLDPKTKKFERFVNNPNDPYSISSDKIYNIIEDSNGNIWLGTYGKGISMFDARTRHFNNYELSAADIDRLYKKEITDGLKHNIVCSQVRSLLLKDPEHIWVGTDGGGIEVFNTSTNSFEAAMYPYAGNSSGIQGSAVLSMADDQFGNTWLAMFQRGLDIYNKSSQKIQHYTRIENDVYGLNSAGVRFVYPDRNGNVWLGTNGDGINIYFLSTSTITHIRRSERPGVGENTLLSSKIMSMIEDKNGLLWIGTGDGGVTTLDRDKGIYTQHPELSTAPNNGILSMMESSDGTIWVGTWGQGLNRKDPKTGKISYYTPDNQLKNGAIMCLCEEPKTGFIWFGTFGAGLYRLDPKTDSLKQFSVESDSLSSNNIFALHFDKSGTLWVGTRTGGVMRYNSLTGKFIAYEHDDKNKKSLSNNLVYCITEDKEGNVWLSTANGLDRFDSKTDSFDAWYEGDGLPSDNIYGILIDDEGNLWLSHNKGISRFNPSLQKDAFRNFGYGTGVQPAEFNQGAYFRNKKGELFFGGQAGLNIIDPKKVDMKFPPPPVYIISYKRFGKEIKLDTSIENTTTLSLTWRDNNFMFDLAALDYVDPLKNLYQYKLEGSDDEWSPVTTNRYVSYTNLPGGDYTLFVRASDENGNWSDQKALIHIHIQPPFWKTNWFYTFCVLVIIGGIFGFIRYRTAAIKTENRILEAKVAERTQELAEKNADITSSIQYAKRIQSAILPELGVIYEHFPESFVLYKPKDIVSGDFYWFEEKDGKNILAVGDCTGHGVPGALMSMIGHNLINQIVLEKGIVKPDEILNHLNEGVRAALKQDHHEQETTDGMDIAICSIDLVKKEILFAGALRPLIVIRKGLLSKVESDRFPIGGSQDTRDKKFTSHKFLVEKGDILYMFSDGFADQFGGERGKKFMIKNLLQKLTEVQDKPMKEQSALLESAFDQWKSGYQQVDDVLIVGVRIP